MQKQTMLPTPKFQNQVCVFVGRRRFSGRSSPQREGVSQ